MTLHLLARLLITPTCEESSLTYATQIVFAYLSAGKPQGFQSHTAPDRILRL